MSDDDVAHGRLGLLGGFRVGKAGSIDGLSLPARRLVAYLALYPGRHPRDRLAESLWPDRPRDLSRLNLRQALFQERRAGHGLLRATRAELSLVPSVTVDLHMVVARVRRLLAPYVDQPVELDESDLVNDLLPGWDDQWLDAEREHFRELRLHGLEVLSERWLQRGEWSRAIGAALLAAAVDPYRESAQALLIRGHLGQHNNARAHYVFGSYCEMVRRELGVEPSCELAGLLEPIPLPER